MTVLQNRVKKLEAKLVAKQKGYFLYKGKKWPILEDRRWGDLTSLPTPERRSIAEPMPIYFRESQGKLPTDEEKEWVEVFEEYRVQTLTQKEKEEDERMRKAYEEIQEEQNNK